MRSKNSNSHSHNHRQDQGELEQVELGEPAGISSCFIVKGRVVGSGGWWLDLDFLGSPPDEQITEVFPGCRVVVVVMVIVVVYNIY